MIKLTKKWCEEKGYTTAEVPWGFMGFGYIVYKRTYARKKPNGMKEEWWETVLRVTNGMQSVVRHYTQEELETIYGLIFNLKMFPGGRSLWLLGTRITDRRRATGLQNCWFRAIDCLDSFLFVLNCLMQGGGVGIGVQRKFVYELPKVKRGVKIEHQLTNDADCIVPDSREGWVWIMKKVFQSYFETGESFTYSTILVRHKGAEVKGFGGEAAGPQVLIDGISNVCKIMDSRAGKKLRSIDVLDINCIFGMMSEAGTRRSALSAIGDSDDVLFLQAKLWSKGTIPAWRSNSNNSVDCSDIDTLLPIFWEGYKPVKQEDGSYTANGEPYGLVNIDTTQKFARIGHVKPDKAVGFNPCFEAQLEDGEPCNLSEQVLPAFDSLEEMKESTRLLYIYQKNVCKMRYDSPKTQEVVSRNFRIGMGITGLLGASERLEWLRPLYDYLVDIDIEYSTEHELPLSIRLSCLKPSGTLGKLAGCSPGLHPFFAKFWMQAVRMKSADPLVQFCRDAGCKTEYLKELDGGENKHITVVYFPCKATEGAVVASEMSAIAQLEFTRRINKEWSDQSSSVTIYYRPEEYDGVINYLKENWADNFKTLSFSLHSSHGFAQAPYTEITEEKYKEEIAKIDIRKLTSRFDDDSEFEDLESNLECGKGGCPLK
jgi:ribonucleoside-triphosphate reductase